MDWIGLAAITFVVGVVAFLWAIRLGRRNRQIAELRSLLGTAPLPVEALIVDTLPKMDPSSAVFPTIRVVGGSLVLAYHLPGCEASAVIRFNGMKEWAYGYPNDEGLHEHPLWGKGLTYYEFHEVQSLEGEMPLWIWTFHGGTLTVRAQSVEVVAEQVASRPREAIDAFFGAGVNKVLDET